MEQPKEPKIDEEAIRLEQEKRKLEASIKEMDAKKKEEVMKPKKEEKKSKETSKAEAPKATGKMCEDALKLLYDRKLDLNKEREKLDEEIRKVEHQRNLLKIKGL